MPLAAPFATFSVMGVPTSVEPLRIVKVLGSAGDRTVRTDDGRAEGHCLGVRVVNDRGIGGIGGRGVSLKNGWYVT